MKIREDPRIRTVSKYLKHAINYKFIRSSCEDFSYFDVALTRLLAPKCILHAKCDVEDGENLTTDYISDDPRVPFVFDI